MWNPIITEIKERKKIEKKIDEIYFAIKSTYHTNGDDTGFASGDTGILLFVCYYLKFKKINIPEANRYLIDLIDNCFQQLNSRFDDVSYCHGMSGYAWSFNHLIKENLIELKEFDNLFFCDIVSKYLHPLCMADNNDFLHGSLGICHYLNESDYRVDKEIVDEYIDSLLKLSIKVGDDKLCWESVLHNEFSSEKVINLGLAHGLPSLIIVFCELLNLFPLKSKLKELVLKSASYIMDQKESDGKFFSLYPSFVGIDKGKGKNSRMGWCYGDLGVAFALNKAGHVLGNSSFIRESGEIAMHSSKRKGLELQKVFDSGFCHGTSGIMHLFNRLYNYSNNTVYKECALYWLDETMKLANYEDGLAGFKKYKPKVGLLNETGVLEGIAGVGLTLISSISEIEPRWDSFFLLSSNVKNDYLFN